MTRHLTGSHWARSQLSNYLAVLDACFFVIANDFFSRKTDDDSDFDLDCLPNDGGNFNKISSSRGRGAPKSRSEIVEIQLKKLVKSMTQSKRDALKKHTEKEKEKLAIEVRAFTDEQGKIRAGQVYAYRYCVLLLTFPDQH